MSAKAENSTGQNSTGKENTGKKNTGQGKKRKTAALQHTALPLSPFPPDVACVRASSEEAVHFSLLPQEAADLPPHASRGRMEEFVLGRGCARKALAILNPALASAPLPRGNGRMPVWPQGATGSLTHKHGFAAAAAALCPPYRGLGIDLEQIKPYKPGLWARVMTPEERDLAREWPPDVRERWFALVFSAKEALYKAINPLGGVYIGFQEARITPLPGWDANADAEGESGAASGRFAWQVLKQAGEDFPQGFSGEGAFTRTKAWVLSGVWLML